jgi:hypothetical protein
VLRGNALPACYRSEGNEVLHVLRLVREALQAKHGGETLPLAVEAAVTYELRPALTTARLVARWLRQGTESKDKALGLDQQLRLLEKWQAAGERVNKVLARLGIDQAGGLTAAGDGDDSSLDDLYDQLNESGTDSQSDSGAE